MPFLKAEEPAAMWVVVNIMVPFWVPIIIRHLIGYPKRDPNFDKLESASLHLLFRLPKKGP